MMLFVVVLASHLPAQTVWLDELDLSAATQGFGVAGKNTSVDKKPITIAGQTYTRGFGTHAESSLMIELRGFANLFSAFVGVDDEVKGHQPAIEFIVYGDGAKIWSSGVMRLNDPAKLCSVSVAGIRKLELVVSDGGNGNY
ncbi:MAG: alpha-galactosidase, partial [Pedobacter sp.]